MFLKTKSTRFLFLPILLVALAMIAASPLRPYLVMRLLSMTPTEAATVILGIVGAGLQLVFLYVPGASDWYQAQANKGLIMLGLIVATSAVYFALACTSLAAMLHIGVACTITDLFTLLQAVYILATSQAITYLLTKNSTPKRFRQSNM